jgi:hypothetical protein
MYVCMYVCMYVLLENVSNLLDMEYNNVMYER